MKKTLLAIACAFVLNGLHAQNTSVESEIRKMEDAERQAVIAKDTAALGKIWSSTFLVNAPLNRVVPSDGSPARRPVIASMTYTTFTREIEFIQEKEGVVFSMGNETIVPAANMPNAGQTIKRRYTNIWMKENGAWRLVARHANVICQ